MEAAILDTTVLIDYLRREPTPEAIEVFQEIKSGRLTGKTTSISAFEVYWGAELSPNSKERLAEAEALLDVLPCLPVDEAAARLAAEAGVNLERRGEAIDIRDLLIGAIAKVQGLPLITANLNHFSRIPQLRVKSPEQLLHDLRRGTK